MTQLAAANEAMMQLFVDVWTPSGIAYTLDNETYDPPDNAAWARFSIRTNASTQDTLGAVGNRKYERSGSCFVQIFVLSNTGTEQSRELAQRIIDGFEGARIAGTTIRFNDVIPSEVGPDGKWFQTNVEINFVFDETR